MCLSMEMLGDMKLNLPPGLQHNFSSSSVLPKLSRDQADDATPDDEQEVVHPQERLQLGKHERQEGGEEEPAVDRPRELPASRQPAVQHDGAVNVMIVYIYISVQNCLYPWIILGAPLHPCAGPS